MPIAPQPAPGSPPTTAPVEESPADKPTPLLDAAIERVTAVTRDQREALDSSPPASEPESHTANPVAPGLPAVDPVPAQRTAPPPSPSSGTAEAVSAVAPAVIKVTGPPSPSVSPTVPKDAARSIVVDPEPSGRDVAERDAFSPAQKLTERS